MPKDDWIEPLVYAIGGAASSFIINRVLEKKYPNISLAKRTMVSGGLVSGGGAVTAYALDENRGYHFALGSLGYTAASLTYRLVSPKGLAEIASERRSIPGDDYDDFVIVDGTEEPIATKGLFKLVDWREEPEFDLHPTKKFSKRRAPIKRMVLHHGGYDPYFLANVFKGSRNASSHFGIGYDRDGEIIVAQYLDPVHESWHAGYFNKGSVGIDFAFVPSVENQSRYGWPIVKTESKRIRQPSEVLRVPDEILDAAAQFLRELHRVLGLEMRVNQDNDALVSSFEELENSELGDATVIGDHNVRYGKWDVFYLWDRLLERTNPSNSIV